MAIGGELFGLGRAADAYSSDPEAYTAVQGDRTKQLIAQMLLMRGMQSPQGQMVGRFYVPPSPLQHASGMLQSLGGLGMMTMADQQRAEMAKAIQQRQDQEIKEFQDRIAPQEKPMTFADLGGPFPVKRSEMPDTFDINELQGGNTVDFIKGPNVAQTRQHAQQYGPATGTDIPVKDRYGDQPATQEIPGMMKTVPRSREEIERAMLEAKFKRNPLLQQGIDFLAKQQQFAAEQQQREELKALDRQNKLEQREIAFDQAIATATMMGASKEQIAAMRDQLEKIKEEGRSKRDNLEVATKADPTSSTGWSEYDRKTGKLIMKDVAPPSSAVQQEKNQNQGIKIKSLPASVGREFIENSQNLRMAERAYALISGKTVEGMKGDKDAVGWKGYLPDSLLQRMDPAGVDTRAAVANLGSLIIHDRSGAAVTAAEYPRLRPFIPKASDDAETTAKKLNQFVTEYRKVIEEMTDFYAELGYDVPKSNWHRGVEDDSRTQRGTSFQSPQPSREMRTTGSTRTPASISSDAEYNALPSGTLFIGPDGKTRKKP